jgi:hypothetical protein
MCSWVMRLRREVPAQVAAVVVAVVVVVAAEP